MATTQWIGGSGSWHDPANWSNGVPGPDDDAIINLGDQTDTISGGGTVGAVTVEGALGQNSEPIGSLTVTGTIDARTLSNSDDILTIAPGAELLLSGAANNANAKQLMIVQGTLEDANFYGGGGASDFTSSVTVSGAAALWQTSDVLWTGSMTVTDGARIDAGTVEVGLAMSLSLGPGVVINGPVDATDGPSASFVSAFADSTGAEPAVINGPFSGPGSVYVRGGATLVINGPASGIWFSGGGLLLVNGTYTGGATFWPTSGDVGGGTLALDGPVVPNGEPIDFSLDGELILGPQATAEGGPVLVEAFANDTIFAAVEPVFAQGGRVTFVNGSAASTVLGGGSATVFGGAGGGVFFGGKTAANLIVAGTGAATIGGAAWGDQLYANGPAGDLLAAGFGQETLSAGGSTGNNTIFGGSAEQRAGDLIVAGSGNDLVVAGSGMPTIFGGATGNTAIFAGSGEDLIVLGGGADYVQLGTGNATAYAGTGADLFGVYNDQAGGNDIVGGFKNGTDQIALRGYAAAPSIVSRGGNTTITLSDNTQITLLGVRSLDPNAFV